MVRPTRLHRLRAARLGLGLVLLLGAGNPVLAAPPASAQGTAPPETYYVQDIKAAMLAHVKAGADAEGVFRLKDDLTGDALALRFVKIHDPVRRIDGTTYFACTDFVSADQPEKVYDLDFWMRPVNGELRIYDTKVHKEPRQSLVYGWYKYPRYTFIDDEVVYLY